MTNTHALRYEIDNVYNTPVPLQYYTYDKTRHHIIDYQDKKNSSKSSNNNHITFQPMRSIVSSEKIENHLRSMKYSIVLFIIAN